MGEGREGICVCIMADSHHYIAETDNIVKQLFSNFFLKKKLSQAPLPIKPPFCLWRSQWQRPMAEDPVVWVTQHGPCSASAKPLLHYHVPQPQEHNRVHPWTPSTLAFLTTPLGSFASLMNWFQPPWTRYKLLEGMSQFFRFFVYPYLVTGA